MTSRTLAAFGSLTCAALAAVGFNQAHAQMSAPPMVSVVPGVSSISVANAAGVLKYCERNGLVSVVGADAVLSRLPSKPDSKSAAYTKGATGRLIGDGGKELQLSAVPGHVRSRACNMVLQRAKGFLPAR